MHDYEYLMLLKFFPTLFWQTFTLLKFCKIKACLSIDLLRMCVIIWAFPSENMVHFKTEWASPRTDCCQIFSIANLKKPRRGASTVFPKNVRYTAVILYSCEIYSRTSCAYGCGAPLLLRSYNCCKYNT